MELCISSACVIMRCGFIIVESATCRLHFHMSTAESGSCTSMAAIAFIPDENERMVGGGGMRSSKIPPYQQN
jgi:hypothetical protein